MPALVWYRSVHRAQYQDSLLFLESQFLLRWTYHIAKLGFIYFATPKCVHRLRISPILNALKAMF
jgi:hypothetical protein